MRAILKITKVHPSHGQSPRVYHQSDSELAAERSGDSVCISVREGERRSPPDAVKGMESAPEKVAAIYLTADEVRALAAFLGVVPADA